MKYVPKLAPMPSDSGSRIPVTEMFYSVQGEGRFAGFPALFLRFKYCNLGCSWCDTRFSWDSDKIETGELLEVRELADRVIQLTRSHEVEASSVHVVFTGGEPMLHQHSLPDLTAALREVGFAFFEIETNGTILPTDLMLKTISWWNCSPKLANNGLDRETNIVPEALRRIASSGKADFKFVVRTEEDVAELIRDVQEHLPPDSVWLMPEGMTTRRQIELTPEVMALCVKYGFHFSPRLHILAWGNERGR